MDVWAELKYETRLSNLSLFPLLLLSLTGQRHSPECSRKIKDEYDYVIVGGGSAGSVVAGRLSEEPCVSVLLLEAGPKPPLISEVPRLSQSLLRTELGWKFEIAPQKHLAGNRNKMVWNFGKMLGGSGNLNGLVYVRGNHKDYDDWAAQGAKGWSYEDVLPYFLKLEDNKNLEMLDKGFHQTGGPISVEESRFHSELKNALHNAVKELGYEFVDSNGARQTGFNNYQLNTKDGQRCSSVKGYLVPAEHRPNLDIMLNATVTKVIIKGDKATAVEYYYNGKFRKVKARKEVIVSAGAVNTPKLLMLSGVGPREELEKWKIPVVADLPVGKNLQDHGASTYYFTIDPRYSRQKSLYDPSNLEEYINYRSGPLARSTKLVVAFLNGLNSTTTTDFPNFKISLDEILKETKDGSKEKLEVFLTCTSQHLHPKSRGTITLRSSDPFDPPVIDPNYLEYSSDLDDIVDGFKMCKEIVSTKALQRLGAKPYAHFIQGCKDYESSEENYLKCYVKHFFSSNFHVVGTAKMGDPKHLSTVVDPDLRVKGIKRLRVVDASVMPIVPSGNNNIPTMMVAEKASDILKKSIKCIKETNYSSLKLFCNLL